MTQRERQLLEWIRENPMISQQELADKAGITRSSTAGHISISGKRLYRRARLSAAHRAVYRRDRRREHGHRRRFARGARLARLEPWPRGDVARRRRAQHRPQPLPARRGGLDGDGARAGQLCPECARECDGHRPRPDAQRRHPRRAHRHLSLHRRAGRRHGARRERHGHLRAHHAGVPAPADGLHQPRRPRRDGDEPTRRVAAVAVPALRGSDSGRPRLHDQGAEARCRARQAHRAPSRTAWRRSC